MNFTQNQIARALKVIVTVFAAIYATIFLGMLISRFSLPAVSNVDVDWSVPQNPRFTIALILVTATAFLWVLRGVGQSIAALVLAAAVFAKVFFWWDTTNSIKANTGLAELPRTNWIGNVFIGASSFELVALIATLSLVAFGIVSLLRRPERAASPQRQLHTLHP